MLKMWSFVAVWDGQNAQNTKPCEVTANCKYVFKTRLTSKTKIYSLSEFIYHDPKRPPG